MNRLTIFAALLMLFFMACEKNEDKEIEENNLQDEQTEEKEAIDIQVSDNFLYKTATEVNLSLTVKTLTNVPAPGALVKIYNYNPENEEKSEDLNVLFKGITDENGNLNAVFGVPSYLEEIVICPQYIGVISNVTLPVQSQISYTFGTENRKSYPMQKTLKSKNTNYLYLGDYNALGKPDYLTQDDEITTEYLKYINSILPERAPVPVNNPQYIAESAQSNIVLTAEAEAWLTFIHEGAGWKNVVGYYTYPTDNPPQSTDAITNMTVIFPNTSYKNSGGELKTGNKVKLKYYTGTEFVDTFPSNTTIAWFLVGNAWKDQKINDGKYTHYSDYQFNVEPETNLKRHNVLLLDAQNERLIVGFEDIRRDASNCDQDFNDAIFYATINPFGAVKDANIIVGNPRKDMDDDGVPDNEDEYPENPALAFNNYTNGFLAYEDLWYSQGDYDFNDLVTNYKINRLTDAKNKVVKIEATYIIHAIGAGFHNGFGFELPIDNSRVKQVTGSNLETGYIETNANGTEANQEKAVIIAFDDAYNVFANHESGFINVYKGHSFIPYDSVTITVELTEAISQQTLGIPPFNPFIIKNGKRDFEIHLPGYTATQLHDINLWGNGDDDSDPTIEKYYLTENNLPWAIHLPETFDHPLEGKYITNAYLHFKKWAESDGTLYPDWYKNKTGYRNDDLIYYPNE